MWVYHYTVFINYNKLCCIAWHHACTLMQLSVHYQAWHLSLIVTTQMLKCYDAVTSECLRNMDRLFIFRFIYELLPSAVAVLCCPLLCIDLVSLYIFCYTWNEYKPSFITTMTYAVAGIEKTAKSSHVWWLRIFQTVQKEHLSSHVCSNS